jgi:hypothetical protein
VIKFTNVWNGNISNNWFVADNWNCGAVPDQYTDVVIPNGIFVYPVINANTAIRSIRAHPGAIVTITGTAELQILGR